MQKLYWLYLCDKLVYFLTKKIYKHIERDFHPVAKVMPEWWDLVVLGLKIFSEHGHFAYQIEGDDE